MDLGKGGEEPSKAADESTEIKSEVADTETGQNKNGEQSQNSQTEPCLTDTTEIPQARENNSISHQTQGTNSQQTQQGTGEKKIELHTEFCSFLELRDAIGRYQRENSVQLIVKDSKLLKAESTRKVFPKVYHLVNQSLMYHSITYCCKCHGELKQKPHTRIKNAGAKRLNCPMYFRLKLTSDLQRLVIFDMDETHNHGIDPTTCQMTPRQQVYTLSRLRQGKRDMSSADVPVQSTEDVASLIASAIKDVSSVSSTSSEPLAKMPRRNEDVPHDVSHEDDEVAENGDHEPPAKRPASPLDSESSFSDSDDDEESIRQHLLPFPVRLIGSAVQSSPELLAASRQLIELQKSKLDLERQKLLLQTKNLELCNAKLELEVKKMERALVAEMSESEHGQDTTIYLQAS